MLRLRSLDGRNSLLHPSSRRIRSSSWVPSVDRVWSLLWPCNGFLTGLSEISHQLLLQLREQMPPYQRESLNQLQPLPWLQRLHPLASWLGALLKSALLLLNLPLSVLTQRWVALDLANTTNVYIYQSMLNNA